MTPLNPNNVQISPNLSFEWIPRKYRVYSGGWKEEEAAENKDLL